MSSKVIPLWIVADTSGSMGEAAKLYILRNLINYTRERLSFPHNDLSFDKIYVVTWNEEVKPLKIDSKHDLPEFEVKGKADIEKLTKYFDEISQNNKEKTKLLILSDWKLDNKNNSMFINWAKNQKNNFSIRIVPIETGLSMKSISKMSSRNYFHPQDIIKLLSPWE